MSRKPGSEGPKYDLLWPKPPSFAHEYGFGINSFNRAILLFVLAGCFPCYIDAEASGRPHWRCGWELAPAPSHDAMPDSIRTCRILACVESSSHSIKSVIRKL